MPDRQYEAVQINEHQKARLLAILDDYLRGTDPESGRALTDHYSAIDAHRRKLIESDLQPLVAAYVAGNVQLAEFKSSVDGINKRNELWGFKGIKGQMFFNLLVNNCEDSGECDTYLKSAIAAPASDLVAHSQMTAFHGYVRRVGEHHVKSGGSKQGRPTESSVPFFLSYFWQIEDSDKWPVYYTNAVNMMSDLNLIQVSEDVSDNYSQYKRINDALARLFSETCGWPFDYYGVEHVFYAKGGNPYEALKVERPKQPIVASPQQPRTIERIDSGYLPESYVPPIVAILPKLAVNEPELRDAAKASGTSIERAFEKNINAVFTILGYDCRLLGQGQGRVPDGRAIDRDDGYGIIWDAKVRAEGYAMGTDDRVIRDYITTQSRELKRQAHLRNIYYLIVSSRFRDDFDDLIRSLKMETDVNEVCLLEAEALVALVDLKLRDPNSITRGPDGIQRLFSTSGIVREADVRGLLA